MNILTCVIRAIHRLLDWIYDRRTARLMRREHGRHIERIVRARTTRETNETLRALRGY